MAKDLVCTSCETVGPSKRVTKGSLLIEIFLWLCFLVPGLLYSLWRLTTRYDACRSCLSTTLIPSNSPAGQKFLKKLSGSGA